MLIFIHESIHIQEGKPEISADIVGELSLFLGKRILCKLRRERQGRMGPGRTYCYLGVLCWWFLDQES